MLSNTEYHAHPAVSRSTLHKILSSTTLRRAKWELENPKPETESMALGSLVHCMILEPSMVDFMFELKLDGRTKEGKAQKENLKEIAKTLVSASDWADAKCMADAVMAHPIASKLFIDGVAEQAVFGDIDGLNCKCKPDYFKNNGILVDLKTTDDASPEAFVKSAIKYGYDMQAVMYKELTGASAFVFVCVEKTAPFDVAVYVLDDEFYLRGKKRMHDAISLYKDSEINNSWPGYEKTVQVLTLPAWVKS